MPNLLLAVEEILTYPNTSITPHIGRFACAFPKANKYYLQIPFTIYLQILTLKELFTTIVASSVSEDQDQTARNMQS